MSFYNEPSNNPPVNMFFLLLLNLFANNLFPFLTLTTWKQLRSMMAIKTSVMTIVCCNWKCFCKVCLVQENDQQIFWWFGGDFRVPRYLMIACNIWTWHLKMSEPRLQCALGNGLIVRSHTILNYRLWERIVNKIPWQTPLRIHSRQRTSQDSKWIAPSIIFV